MPISKTRTKANTEKPSDLSGDPFDDDPPSLLSASPSEDDDPEDPENPTGMKKKKKRKSRRQDRRHSKEAKAIATSKIVVNLPEFTRKDLSEFAKSFGRFLGMTGHTHASGRVKCDQPLQCRKTKYLEKQVKHIVTKSATFADVLVALERHACSTLPTRQTCPSGQRSRTWRCCPTIPRRHVSPRCRPTWTIGLGD